MQYQNNNFYQVNLRSQPVSSSNFLNFNQAGQQNGADNLISRRPVSSPIFNWPAGSGFSRPPAGNVRFVPGALLSGQRAGEAGLPQANVFQNRPRTAAVEERLVFI